MKIKYPSNSFNHEVNKTVSVKENGEKAGRVRRKSETKTQDYAQHKVISAYQASPGICSMG